jgi:hypothetical protein
LQGTEQSDSVTDDSFGAAVNVCSRDFEEKLHLFMLTREGKKSWFLVVVQALNTVNVSHCAGSWSCQSSSMYGVDLSAWIIGTQGKGQLSCYVFWLHQSKELGLVCCAFLQAIMS